MALESSRRDTTRAEVTPMKRLTVAQVKRRRCVRCTRRPGFTTWHICADGNRPRVLCASCDIALNRMVLRWAFHAPFTNAEKMRRYETRVRRAAPISNESEKAKT